MEYRLIRHFGQLEEHANAVGTDLNPCASGRRKGAGAGRCGAWRIGIDLNIPANELFQLISRFSATDMLIDPTFPDVERSADASIVEITLLTGRNDDRKRSLYKAIAAGAVAAGFRSDDVMVALIENGPIDWSLGRGEAYDKHG